MAVPYWRLSAFYACYFAALGVLLPYWSLFLKHAGFDARRIGELTALLVATRVVAPYIWGWLADHGGKRLLLVRVTSLLAAAAFSGFLWLAADFWCYAALTAAFSFFWNACLPQFEAATLFHLRDVPHRYGKVRLWGSMGFIAAVYGVGLALDAISVAYVPHIILGLMALSWLCALVTPDAPARLKAQGEELGLGRVLANKEVWAFFGVYFLLQIVHGPYYVFFSVYLQQHHYSSQMTGGLWALGVGAEVLLFMVANRLTRRFSLRSLLLWSLLLTGARWWLVAVYVDQILCLIGAQLLHAASFGVTHLVAVQFLMRYFGERHQGKGQAFYSSLSYGVGGMCGSLYSGYAWERFGAGEVFLIAAGVSLLAWLLAWVGVGKRRDRRVEGIEIHDA